MPSPTRCNTAEVFITLYNNRLSFITRYNSPCWYQTELTAWRSTHGIRQQQHNPAIPSSAKDNNPDGQLHNPATTTPTRATILPPRDFRHRVRRYCRHPVTLFFGQLTIKQLPAPGGRLMEDRDCSTVFAFFIHAKNHFLHTPPSAATQPAHFPLREPVAVQQHSGHLPPDSSVRRVRCGTSIHQTPHNASGQTAFLPMPLQRPCLTLQSKVRRPPFALVRQLNASVTSTLKQQPQQESG